MAADSPQRRLEAVEGGPVASDHHGQCSRRCSVGAAADRRVQQGDALLGADLVQTADNGGGIGGKVEDYRVASGALQYSALAQDHRLDVPGDGEAG